MGLLVYLLKHAYTPGKSHSFGRESTGPFSDCKTIGITSLRSDLAALTPVIQDLGLLDWRAEQLGKGLQYAAEEHFLAI
jgi:hypothetical protein